MDDTLKAKVLNLLQQNFEPKDIAERLGESYTAILRFRRLFEEAKLNGTINDLVNMDKVIIDEVGRTITNNPDAAKAVTDGLTGLERLSANFQQTATEINLRARGMISGVDSAQELEILTEILCRLNTAFINTKSTQINIQNNGVGDSALTYGEFLSDAPGN